MTKTAVSWPSLAAILLSLFLAACNSGSGPRGDSAAATEPDPAKLCITTDCGTREVLLRVPEAENLVFSDDGRLFVSGEELYEIVKKGDGSFEAVVIPTEGTHSASLGGLAIRDGVLYMNDESERGLWAGRLQPDLRMQKIHTHSGSPTPNGLAFGPDGALYSTSGPTPDFTTLTSVTRLHLDPADPYKVLSVEKVFGMPELPGANGLVLKGNTFYIVGYLSDLPQLSAVHAFDVAADGTVGPLRAVASSQGTYDDIEVIGNRLLVANNFLNSLLMFDLDSGEQLADSGPIFQGPTSLTWGRPPMFSVDDLVVAERGFLGESGSGVGDVLSVFRRNSP